MEKSIRVLLVDDHPLLREGIRSSLSSNSDITVVGEAGDGLEGIEKTATLAPDIVLLDIGMPKMNGLEAAKILNEKHSQSKILILTMHKRWEYAQRLLDLGVKGYILKDAPLNELGMAIRQVSLGQVYVSPELGPKPIVDRHARGTLPHLSQRELEVLKWLATSSRSKDVAAKLGISVRTVEKHRAHIMKKLGIDNIAGLTRYALSPEHHEITAISESEPLI